MAVNPLPPQAFTKETLQKAYTWLLTQSASIKEMASTQDMLVSLYLKAQRSGEASLDTPSIQNFKQELKSLAGILGDLQTPPAIHVDNTHPSMAMPQQPPHTSSLGSTYTTQTAVTQTHQTTHHRTSTGGFSLNQLDMTSLQALSDIKTTLNLSSEAEALRALIALGYRQFKKIHG